MTHQEISEVIDFLKKLIQMTWEYKTMRYI